MVRKSVQVSSRNNTAEHVTTALLAHKAEVVAGLAMRNSLLPTDKQLSAAAIDSFITWMIDVIAAEDDKLAKLEMSYVAEQASEVGRRKNRTDKGNALAKQLTHVRSLADKLLGPVGMATYGLEQLISRTPTALVQRAHVVIGLLRANPLKIPDGVGGEFDTVAIANAIEASLRELQAALAEVKQSKPKQHMAKLARDRELAEWGHIHNGGVGALTDLYRVAGKQMLAERIRPTIRRSSSDAPQEPTATQPTGSGSTVPQPPAPASTASQPPAPASTASQSPAPASTASPPPAPVTTAPQPASTASAPANASRMPEVPPVPVDTLPEPAASPVS